MQWEGNTKEYLKSGNIGSKQWWNIIKEKMDTRDESIPPLDMEDGSTVLTTDGKKSTGKILSSEESRTDSHFLPLQGRNQPT